MREAWIGPPGKNPTELGKPHTHLGLSFPTGDIIGLEKPYWCGIVSTWKRGNVVKVKLLVLSSNMVLLGLYGPEWLLQAHPLVLGFSQWHLTYG